MMAEFQSVVLSNSTSGSNVLFKVDAQIKFQTHELNTRWFLDIDFKEWDRMSRDDFLYSTSRTFTADAVNKSVSFSFSAPKSKVNTEPGKEEVYAMVDVVPLEEPAPFRRDSAKTNQTKVDA
jgi:hypothetical protein